MDEPIYITQPSLPPLEELQPYLEQIWNSHQLTNCGPFHKRLEVELAEHLGVNHLSLFANGTLALVTALQALGIHGEVITTPYSFVATTHALNWNRITPVFVDIDPQTLNLDPAKIEAAITPATTAILATHVYGHPCDVAAIQQIADDYGLKVIYDAAHAFGVEDESGSVLAHGDLAIQSYHATKVFTTFEGGAIISPSEKSKRRIDFLKNFGFADEVTVVDCGINGKMNELQAAVGLAQLPHVERALALRGLVDRRYRELLRNIKGLRLHTPTTARKHNYAYFPIFIEPEFSCSRDELYTRLRDNNIICRRYFYPLISHFPSYRNLPSADPANLPVAEVAAQQVICLPIYPELPDEVPIEVASLCGATP
jgi:dTDP-4-amino-4,6-dideoxygalactose transaminase